MKAVIYTQYGSPDKLHLSEVNKPVPKNNEVLIKVYASSINSWDWDMLRGKPFLVRMFGGILKPKQKILGADIAGIVEAVGSEVKDFKPSDEVMGDIAGAGFGGFAEYAVAPEKLLCKKPKQLSFEQSAALPQAGLLAIQGLRYQTQIKAGDKVLINGAGGGVGPIALQYAKSLGAIVTCVDKEEKFELLYSLGADECIDYRTTDYTKSGKKFTYILDVTAHKKVSDYKRALQPDGVFAMIGGSMGWLLIQMMLAQPLLSKYRKQKLGIMGYRVSTEALEELALLAAKKNILPVIDSVFSLEETANAFHHFEKGNFKGKIVIAIAPE
jgi:NADPH:quinone reductase-like Zn-dependent oxidoreductase